MKTFELTQEQINQLAEKKHAKELLQKFIPEAFENELEVGKWYISEYYLVYYLGNYKCNCIELSNGEWFENAYHSLSGHLKSYRLATEEEVVKALINEAIKRGYKKGVKCKFGAVEHIRTLKTNEFKFVKNELVILDSKGFGDVIFKNGKWAEIVIEDIPTQEEIDRVINYLKNK